jgi:hypothetical protein
METTIKFTEEEQKSIIDLRTQTTNLFIQLGQIKIEKDKRLKELNDIEDQLLESYQTLVEREQELFKSLNEKYGDGNYNPETGEFVPIEK